MAELTARPGGPARVAIVVDARGGVFFGELSKALEELKQLRIDYRIVFLEASDDDLVNRYEATRRRHPLAPAGRVVEGIRKERQMMAELRGEADLVIDTSGLTPHDLRDRVRTAVADAPPEEGSRSRSCPSGSSSGRRATPTSQLDVRFLPNPHWVPELRPLPGTDERVRDYVRGQEHYATFSGGPEAMLDAAPGVRRRRQVVPDRRGRLHRRATTGPSSWPKTSAAFFRDRGLPVTVSHRDVDRG